MRPAGVKGAAYLVALCAVAIAAGCGDDDVVNNNAADYEGTEAEVVRVVDDFANAGGDGDSTKICDDIFSTELVANIERESGQSCPSEVEDNLPGDDYRLDVDKVVLNDDAAAATVAVTDEDGSFLIHIERIDADWRIARLANNNAGRYSGTEAEVARAVDDFAMAGWAGDGNRICQEIFTAELAKNIEHEAGQSCTSEVEDNLPEDDYELTIDALTVAGDSATVGVTDQDDNSSTLHMENVNGAWRVARVTAAG